MVLEANALEFVNQQMQKFEESDRNIPSTNGINKLYTKAIQSTQLEQHDTWDPKCPARDIVCNKYNFTGHYRKCGKSKRKGTYSWKYDFKISSKHSKRPYITKKMVNDAKGVDYIFHLDDDTTISCEVGGIIIPMIVDSAEIKVRNKKEDATFYVIRNGMRCLLGKDTATSLGILNIQVLSESITADNGKVFCSQEYKNFCKENNIKHHTIPYWSQQNSEVERQDRDILKRLKISQVTRKDWKSELFDYLMMYNSTPHATTGRTLPELFFRRRFQGKLLSLPNIPPWDKIEEKIRDHDQWEKERGKQYVDRKR
ncbi:hypothetical protein NQ314_017832 [Rhamnusium bicolor]|uniref:Integrase catalytic domain-containing protein n=1 Tax=Rhamnusium bicolor TaxID=1586634 RepID=A0AAV8WSR1_9CUCU|nr:hypothetical protein NQ314_017832 [Rhamnusium bicolor]